MIFQENLIRKKIGLDFIFDSLRLCSPFSKSIIREIKPFSKDQLDQLKTELSNLSKIHISFKRSPQKYDKVCNILQKFKEVRGTITKLATSQILDVVDLYNLKYFSFVSHEFLVAFNHLELSLENLKLYSLQSIFVLLDPKQQNQPTFSIYNQYSEVLQNLREKKLDLESQISTENSSHQKETLLDKRSHIVQKEQAEEAKIREKLTIELQKSADILQKSAHTIGKIDFLIAKARIASKFGAIKPTLKEENVFEIINMKNPYVNQFLSQNNSQFLPLDIKLKSGVSIITGANMGGKTVCLNTILLNVVLAHMGFFIFAKSAIFPVFDFFALISDDMQDIKSGLSSFGAEIIILDNLISYSKNNSGLILFDEFSRGTNPKEGQIIVKALAQFFNNFSSNTVITTHYDGIAQENMLHYQIRGLKEVNLQKLQKQIKPLLQNKTQNIQKIIQIIQENMDYQLDLVSSTSKVPKDAIHIAKMLGIDSKFLELINK
jgi:dsDNA-specific endonuclease/ATPase MutS2